MSDDAPIEYTPLQEVFDRVVRHLYAQRKKAKYVDDDGELACAYRGENGTKCAVGCFIPDEDYTARIEGGGVNVAIGRYANLGRDWAKRLDRAGTFELLRKLQMVHDHNEVASWPFALQKVAKEFGLTWPADIPGSDPWTPA